MTARLRFLSAAVCILGALAARPAQANWFELYGVGGRASAMGNAMTAAADDWSATFYNPALLSLQSQPTLGIGASVALPQTQLVLSRPDPAYTPRTPPVLGGFTAGVGLPLPGRLGEWLSLGVAAYVPMGPFVAVRMLDSAQPYYSLYDYTASTFVIASALALRITDWLRVGLGFHMLATFGGPANVTIDFPNGRFPLSELDSELSLVPAPTAGIALTPLPGLSIGVGFRGALGLGVKLPANVKFDGLDATLGLLIEGITQYSPHTLSFGAAYRLQPIPLMLTVDASYAFWSLAPDPSLQVAFDLTGEDIARLGLDEALDAPVPGNERRLPPGYFSNTLAVRAGAEYEATDWFALRVGYAFRPTHVPLQTSGTNLLDNDTHTLSFGLGARFADPQKFFAGRFSIDLTGQVGIFAPRLHLKDTAADPVGDLATGGTVLSGSVMLRYQFGE